MSVFIVTWWQIELMRNHVRLYVTELGSLQNVVVGYFIIEAFSLRKLGKGVCTLLLYWVGFVELNFERICLRVIDIEHVVSCKRIVTKIKRESELIPFRLDEFSFF